MKRSIAIIAGVLALASCGNQNKSEVMDITGKWNIEKALGLSTRNGEDPAFISFESDGTVNGCTSVNLFSGSYKQDGEAVSLENIGMTRRMGASMEIEEAVTNALNAIASIKVEEGKAFVFNSAKDTVMVLVK